MNFDQAYDLLIGHEGGYVNDPNDPGGETKYGISKRQYPNEDIANLTRERAKLLTKRDYWDHFRVDELPEAIRFDMFDTYYNSRPTVAPILLQKAVGTAQDGHIGPITLAAATAMDPWELRAKFNAARIRFFTSLSTWPNVGRGWANRVAGNLER